MMLDFGKYRSENQWSLWFSKHIWRKLFEGIVDCVWTTSTAARLWIRFGNVTDPAWFNTAESYTTTDSAIQGNGG